MQSKEFIKWLQSHLRGIYRKWEPKNNVLEAARAGRFKNVRTNRLAYHYRCAHCAGLFPASLVEVDHIQPVVDPERGFADWNEYVERLFVSEARLQVLCDPCHDKKTEGENSVRRERKQPMRCDRPKTAKKKKG